MSSDNQINLNEKDNFVSEEDTEISLPPPAPNFEVAQAAPVQPVFPVAPLAGDSAATFTQQPQVVYVAHPTLVEPRRSWGWIPAALALLVVATIAGVFIGAELYKRSIYAESSAPYSTSDVSPYANSTASENKLVKSGEVNSLVEKKETGLSENGKSDSRQINTISTGFAPIQKTDLRENENYASRVGENQGEDYNQEHSEASSEKAKTADDNQAERGNQQTQPDDEDLPPPPVQRKSKDFQPKKVENVKDTENIDPPQRNLPD